MNNLYVPAPDSHKGNNGKLFIIGGSGLFHAPLIWSADIASKIVDMVHVTSPNLMNNRIMEQRLKQKYWNGIVVAWENVGDYIEEDDVILIGPGMERNQQTKEIVDTLLSKYRNKKWVVDGGALQMVDPTLLKGNMIITPHQGEWERLLSKSKLQISNNKSISNDQIQIKYSLEHDGLTILLKGRVDVVVRGEEVVKIEGGNVGMTKGGTGDVLAGLVAALATKNELYLAAQAGSMINKRAGDALFERVGINFNASDLVTEIPHVMR
jgi:NAD(P)H-hydrate epimerase